MPRERYRPTKGVPRRQRPGPEPKRPTKRQLLFLAELGVTTPPTSRAEASALIDDRLRSRRARPG